MAISKEKKQQLLKEYEAALKASNNTVVIQQSGVEVNDITAIRKELHATWGDLQVVRKRLFLRAVRTAGLQDADHASLEGSVAVLYAGEDEMAGLKIISKFAKLLKKEKRGSLGFLWAWHEKDWKDGAYITELANVPSKEELLSKFVYLLNYPVQSFVATLNQVAEKLGGGVVADAVVADVVPEETKVEASVEEVSE